MTTDLGRLSVKIFADGADSTGIVRLAENPLISGFTTNPTLMRAAGVENYELFAREVLGIVTDRPISFEVLSDDFEGMERQALKIAEWGRNVFVKIPITNCFGDSTAPLLERLVGQGVQVNVTAIMTVEQVESIAKIVGGGPAGFVSVFAGRIADTGRDPIPIMKECLSVLDSFPQIELIWASPREILNVFQADAIRCHIITVTHDLLKKLDLVGKELDQFSLETVRMFVGDAQAAGYTV